MLPKNKRLPLLSRAEVTQPASVSPEINDLIKEIGCRKVIIAKDEGTSASRLKHEADMEFAQARLVELQARQRESSELKRQSASVHDLHVLGRS